LPKNPTENSRTKPKKTRNAEVYEALQSMINRWFFSKDKNVETQMIFWLLIKPLYTDPNPPSPSMRVGLEFLVATLSSA
jgi:hypothetical protein